MSEILRLHEDEESLSEVSNDDDIGNQIEENDLLSSSLSSHISEVRVRRTMVKERAQNLANRLKLLEMEEKKAEKRVRMNREKAKQMLRIRQELAREEEERMKSVAYMKQNEEKVKKENARKRRIIKKQIIRNRDIRLKKKLNDVELMKREKAKNLKSITRRKNEEETIIKNKTKTRREEELRRSHKLHKYREDRGKQSSKIYMAKLEWENYLLEEEQNKLREQEKGERRLLQRLRATKLMQQEAANIL